jgi:hypothetical protein
MQTICTNKDRINWKILFETNPTGTFINDIMNILVKTCNPFKWDFIKLQSKFVKFFIHIHPDKNNHIYARDWFEKIVEVKKILLKCKNLISTCKNETNLKERHIFYKLGCCEFHLINHYETCSSYNQFLDMLFFKTLKPFILVKSSQEALDAIVKTFFNKANKLHLCQVDEKNEDFSSHIIYTFSRSIIDYILKNEIINDEKTIIYQYLSNIPYVSMEKTLEERRIYAEVIVEKIICILKLIHQRVEKNPEKKIEKRKQIISESYQAIKKLKVVKEVKELKKIKELETNIWLVLNVTHKYYSEALEYGKKYPNKWHLRTICFKHYSKQEQKVIRGQFLNLKSNATNLKNFVKIDENYSNSNSFIVKQDSSKNARIYFQFIS